MESPRTVRQIAALLAVAVLPLFVSCGSEEPTLGPADTNLELWEGERAVRMLGDEPADEPLLATRIARDLESIRRNYASLPEMDAYRVYSPWYAAQLAVLPDDAHRELLRSGDPWPEFDAVASRLGVEGRKWCGAYAILMLDEDHNPCHLLDSFDGVDGIVGTEPVWHNFTCYAPGACHLIWPQFVGNGLAYLFQWRQDRHSIFTYFRSELGGPHLVGIYDADTDPVPAWWPEVDPPYFDHTCSN